MWRAGVKGGAGGERRTIEGAENMKEGGEYNMKRRMRDSETKQVKENNSREPLRKGGGWERDTRAEFSGCRHIRGVGLRWGCRWKR